MFGFTLLLFLGCQLGLGQFEEQCVIDNRSLLNMWEQKLIKQLRCNYDIFEPPKTNNSEPLKVRMRFTLKWFQYYSEEQEFTVYTWVHMMWNDSRLAWKPDQYDGIDNVLLDGSQIWTPSIRLYNSISDEYDQKYLYMNCKIESDGFVSCTSKEIFSAKCGSDLVNWPYDSQNCKLIFGPWSHYENEPSFILDFSLERRAMTMIASEYGSEWDIMDYQQEEDQNSKKALTMYFRIERHGEVLATTFVGPSIVLSILTVSTLFLDFGRNTRLLIACVTLMYHYDFLSVLDSHIPQHNNNFPGILFYYRSSMIMAMLSVVATFFFKFLIKMESQVPRIVVVFKDYVFNSYGRYAIWPRWRPTVENKSGNCNEWTDICNIVNVVLIFVYVIVYVSLYSVYMPVNEYFQSTIAKKSYYFA